LATLRPYTLSRKFLISTWQGNRSRARSGGELPAVSGSCCRHQGAAHLANAGRDLEHQLFDVSCFVVRLLLRFCERLKL
jgi:hypothetical protein